jgi:hypothetical protein
MPRWRPAHARNPGDEDEFMSSEFQCTPEGKGMDATYAGAYSMSFHFLYYEYLTWFLPF